MCVCLCRCRCGCGFGCRRGDEYPPGGEALSTVGLLFFVHVVEGRGEGDNAKCWVKRCRGASLLSGCIFFSFVWFGLVAWPLVEYTTRTRRDCGRPGQEPWSLQRGMLPLVSSVWLGCRDLPRV